MLYSLLRPHVSAIECPRLLVPTEYREELVKEAYEEIGHRAALPTTRYLQAYGVWPGMTADIKAYIERCPHCEGNRRPPARSRLEIPETPNRPFGCLGVDLIGPL